MNGRSSTAIATCTDTRGQSSVLGTVLILAIIIFTVFSTGVIGIAIIEESQTSSELERAGEAMAGLDAKSNLVAFDGADQYTVDLATQDDEQIIVEEGGSITLELLDQNGTVNETVAEEDLGKIVYQQDNYHIAYQGGGVWRYNEETQKSEFLSPSDFTITNTTTTLPVTVINTSGGDREVDDRVTLTKNESTTHFPTDSSGSNPLTGDNARVTIQSQYYESWGEYITRRTDAQEVGYNHDENEVFFDLVTEGEGETVVSTGVGTAGSDSSITLRGAGGGVFVDAYNSTEGAYAESQSENGAISAQSGVDLSSGGEVLGNVQTEGDLSLSGNARVTGDAAVGGNVQTQGSNSEVEGNITDEVSLVDNPRANTIIISERAAAKDDNDNVDVGALENNGSQSALDTGGSPTFTSGTYIVESFTVPDGDTVEFDLSDGDITLVVDGDVDVKGDVNVVGNEETDARLNTYVTGNSITYDGGEHSVAGDESTASWMYAPAGTQIILDNRANKTGVIYAPGSDGAEGTVNLETDSALFGGVVGGETRVQSQSSVHYDQALRNEQVFDEEQQVDVVANELVYLYFSTTELEVNAESED